MKKAIIFDIDGTLADHKNRLKYIEQKPKKWDLFFRESIHDKPLQHIKVIYDALKKTGKYHIIIMTGRPNKYKEITIEWLQKNGFDYDKLFMRPTNNFKKNIEMKEILLQKIMQYYEVVFAFDDDEKVIELYKKYNIKILHVI